MKIIFLSIIFIQIFSIFGCSFAAETEHQYFTACGCQFKCATVTDCKNYTATINTDTGALSNNITPNFCMTTNDRGAQNLTMSASTNTQSGITNAIFNVSTNTYIILTHADNPPTTAAVADIKNGTPSVANNPNAIAYSISNPDSVKGVLNVSYNSTNKNWQLLLTKRGQTYTSIAIPSGNPLANTYSIDDEAGDYEATITLSFI